MTSFRDQGIARATAFLDLLYADKSSDQINSIHRSLDAEARGLDATDEELGAWLDGLNDTLKLAAMPAAGVA